MIYHEEGTYVQVLFMRVDLSFFELRIFQFSNSIFLVIIFGAFFRSELVGEARWPVVERAATARGRFGWPTGFDVLHHQYLAGFTLAASLVCLAQGAVAAFFGTQMDYFVCGSSAMLFVKILRGVFAPVHEFFEVSFTRVVSNTSEGSKDDFSSSPFLVVFIVERHPSDVVPHVN